MEELQDESVHLVVTSPPYWQLKDYGSDQQIGFHDDYETYINNLNLIWQECHRVLHKGCRLCINIGDQFARSVYYGRYKVIPIRTEIIKFCETIGFDYMGAVIWQKVTTSNTTGGGAIMGSFPYPRNGILKLDYEFILLFKKQGTAPAVSKEQKERSILTKEEWNTYFQGHWNFSGAKQEGHLAAFPEELPKRLIKMFSFVDETVLDPFLGSGTTSLAAKNLLRNSVGYEINKDYLPIIKEKTGANDNQLFGDTQYTLLDRKSTSDSFGTRIAKLPYVFQDPHKLNKKIDPRQLQFGSRINQDSTEREEYFTVKEVLSAEKLVISNNLTIRLLGIEQDKERSDEAINFLITKTKNQRVFIRFDSDKYDEQGNLLCYLYLKNKTFINAHLLKNGFARVDNNRQFRFRQKFNTYMEQYAQ